MRRYDAFSPHDFELFVADLLGAELGMRFETFPRGADRGVDLRATPRSRRRPHVVQCKHYAGSSMSALLAAARAEAQRLKVLRPRPLTYTFVTSRPLTAANKRKLAETLAPFIRHENDVLGASDLDTLLDQHPAVERRQVKLWLTGGTQLAALLRAGTIHRSQALLDEIERGLPRYVHGEMFAEAQDRLREQHVLVIAGVPGIGKTTLARMLLADAVLDGYEPIEISRDVEEGWELLDDRRKQIFLYDDFLGRTALAERFAKNEDRRLIDFMRRAARRKSTRFVLTTREYILRQAAQVYERLEQEALDQRRFLLELPGYSRLDRARIFANHAFHSPNLTTEIKRALLDGRAYERIIDHRNYNPRTIEAITGLAGSDRPLPAADAYVDYAVHVLDHPELIWKHAFEREIDDHGRAMLIALAALPARCPLEALERAFESMCSERDLSLASRAFERTLAALDDSLIRIVHADEHDYPERPGVLVSPYDPSVVDFIREFLRRSSDDARTLARSAIAFEQAEWLWATHSRGNDVPPAGVLNDALEALRRTVFAPALTVTTMSMGTNSWTVRPWGTIDLEERLLTLLHVVRIDDHRLGDMRTWWRSIFAKRVEAWQKGEGEPESLLSLLREVEDEDGVDLDAAARAAREVMRETWAYVQAMEWLADLNAEFPSAFDDDEWAELTEEFERWVSNDLVAHAQDMTHEQELEQVDVVADRLGVEIPDEEWEQAREAVAQAVAERSSEIEPDDDWRERAALRPHDEAREIEAIFTRLADDQ